MVTPQHIKPEWYFLYLYAILRRQDTKLGGVLIIARSIAILAYLPTFKVVGWQGGAQYRNLAKVFYWSFVGNVLLLFYLGGEPAEWPYEDLTKYLSVSYFCLILGFI